MAARTPIVAGNWKMNLDRAKAHALAEAVLARRGEAAGVDLVLCPPSVYLDTVAHYKREIGVTPSTLHDIYEQLLGEGPAAAPSTVQFLRHENRARTFGRRLAAASVRAVS